jgi:hypothetical protein
MKHGFGGFVFILGSPAHRNIAQRSKARRDRTKQSKDLFSQTDWEESNDSVQLVGCTVCDEMVPATSVERTAHGDRCAPCSLHAFPEPTVSRGQVLWPLAAAIPYVLVFGGQTLLLIGENIGRPSWMGVVEIAVTLAFGSSPVLVILAFVVSAAGWLNLKALRLLAQYTDSHRPEHRWMAIASVFTMLAPLGTIVALVMLWAVAALFLA